MCVCVWYVNICMWVRTNVFIDNKNVWQLNKAAKQQLNCKVTGNKFAIQQYADVIIDQRMVPSPRKMVKQHYHLLGHLEIVEIEN